MLYGQNLCHASLNIKYPISYRIEVIKFIAEILYSALKLFKVISIGVDAPLSVSFFTRHKRFGSPRPTCGGSLRVKLRQFFHKVPFWTVGVVRRVHYCILILDAFLHCTSILRRQLNQFFMLTTDTSSPFKHSGTVLQRFHWRRENPYGNLLGRHCIIIFK